MSETIKTCICPLPEARLWEFRWFPRGPSAAAIVKGEARQAVVFQLQSVKLLTPACSVDSEAQVPVG